MQLYIKTTQIIGLGGPNTLQVFGNNAQRAFAIFQCIPAAGACLLSPFAEGLQETSFHDLAQVTELRLLRKDVGDLVTGELWISNGVGNAPQATVVVFEGILV